MGLSGVMYPCISQASDLFGIENAKFWPALAILSRIYTLFGALFTGLNSAVVPQI